MRFSDTFNFFSASSGVEGFESSFRAPRPLKFFTNGVKGSLNFSLGSSAAINATVAIIKMIKQSYTFSIFTPRN